METKKLLIIMIIVFTIILFAFRFATSSIQSYTTIKIRNPFSISVKMVVKCDYKKGKYKVNRVLKLNRKSKATIRIPSVKNCYIYPIDYKLFGKF